MLAKFITGGSPYDASEDQIRSWATKFKREINVGVRCPDIVIGLDVDNYDGKHGETTLGECIDKWGPLPLGHARDAECSLVIVGLPAKTTG